MHTPAPARPAGRSSRRWTLAFAALALLAAFALVAAACGDDDNGDGTATPSDTTATAEPTGSPGGTPTGEASPSPTDDDGNGTADLPDNAQAYASATFQAWLEGDMDLLEQLVAPGALSELESNDPGDPDTWSAEGCDAATGQVACEFRSTDGGMLRLLIDNAKASAGQPEAVIEAAVG